VGYNVAVGLELEVRMAGAGDVGALAWLRALWTAGEGEEPGFEARMAAWVEAEGDRRTTWLAELDGSPVGMGSLFEYRRMPRPGQADVRWGYVSNMFVREELRGRGVGSALLEAIVAAADGRGYAHLVLSPTARAVPFYRRAGFVVPDDAAGDDRLLVRRGVDAGPAARTAS
jgi:GNAT superfamily N-acetyltransferase